MLDALAQQLAGIRAQVDAALATVAAMKEKEKAAQPQAAEAKTFGSFGGGNEKAEG